MRILIGKNSLSQLESILLFHQVSRVFLVTGDSLYERCGAKAYIDSIAGKYIFNKFSDFEENPKIEDIIRGRNQLLDFKGEIIVAIGGGSFIDMAKALSILNQFSEDSIIQTVVENKLNKPVLPLVAIPTTAGSGSEATHFAVIYIDKNKYSISHEDLLPGDVILDSELLKSQSDYQIAVSGIDAFSQAIESMWSLNSTDESRTYSKQAIELLWLNLPKILKTRSDNELGNVMHGAHLAGKAINIAKTTAPHALAYGFTTYCGIPHGHAVALSLPYFIDIHLNVNQYSCIDTRGYDWVLETLRIIGNTIGVHCEDLPSRIATFIKRCGLEISFSNLGIDAKKFHQATRVINVDRLANNPVKIDDNTIMNLLNSPFNRL